MLQTDLEKKLERLIETQNSFLDKLELPKKKDKWDKLSVITTFVASVLLVAIGGVYTAVYRTSEDKKLAHARAQEGRVKELEVVAKVLPYLDNSTDENQQVAAFRLIQALASKEIAEQLAFLKPSRAAIVFVDQTTQAVIHSPDATEEQIREAKSHFEETLRQLIQSQPYYDETSDRRQAARYYAGLDIRSVPPVAALMMLHDLIDRTHVPLSSYKTARVDFLYSIIDLRPDRSLRSIYGELVSEIFNAEHAVPQSWFDRDRST